MSLINQEREGEQIDRALLKNVLGIFVNIGMDNMDYYETKVESTMLEDIDAYYSRKAASRVLENSCPDYMLKVFPKFCFCHANLYVQTLVEMTYKLNQKCVSSYRLKNA